MRLCIRISSINNLIASAQNLSLKYKLVIGFLFIVAINATSGIIGFTLIKEMGNLVRQTYDQALMSGTFALASKYDFSQYDLEVRVSYLAADEKDFNLHTSKAKKELRTLKEDLAVYHERALDSVSPEKISLLNETIDKLESIRVVMSAEKLVYLKKGEGLSRSVWTKWKELPESKKLYRELTALYDKAAEVGYKFRLDSDERIQRDQKRNIIIIGISFAVSLFLSILMSYLIISPLVKLQAVCKEIGGGNFNVRSEVKRTDEFGELSSSFNIMLDTVEEKQESMSSLLSRIPFALFYFDKTGSISLERSKSTDKIFKNFNSYKTLQDFYQDYKIDPEEIASVLEAMFQNAIPFNAASYLLPQVLVTEHQGKKQIIQLSYHPKKDAKKQLEKVIILGEDITEKERANARNLELSERVERVSKVSADIPGFKEFVPAVEQLISHNVALMSAGRVADIDEVKRDLHSAKGLLGIFSFTTIANMIHEVETELLSFEGIYSPALVQKIQDIHKTFQEQTEDLVKLLALNTENNIKFYDERKIQRIQGIARTLKNVELLKVISELDKFPVEKVLAKYSSYAKSIVQKLEDKSVELVFGKSDEISYEEVQKLDAVIIHVLNNSIDHGIESASERVSHDKKEAGTIKITCLRNEDNSLFMIITDDGKGIDGEYLLAKAVRIGLVSDPENYSEKEKANLIFLPGLSSKDTTSMISGRGIGMEAVKNYIESLGGKLDLKTEAGKGTTFEMTIPERFV